MSIYPNLCQLILSISNYLYFFQFITIYAFRALRAHLLFQLLNVALFVSIFSLYNIKQKQQKISDLTIFFRKFSKFYKNQNLPWGNVKSHTKFGPDRFSWRLTDKQTDTQTSKVCIIVNLYIFEYTKSLTTYLVLFTEKLWILNVFIILLL